jgi:hypothetical protein
MIFNICNAYLHVDILAARTRLHLSRDVAIGGVGGVTPPPPPIIQTLVKVGQNGTDICVKLKVKLGIKDEQSCSKL